MWFLRVCETLALARRLRGISVFSVTEAAAVGATRRRGRLHTNGQTTLASDFSYLQSCYRRGLQPRRRVRLPRRILV